MACDLAYDIIEPLDQNGNPILNVDGLTKDIIENQIISFAQYGTAFNKINIALCH